MMFIYEYSEVQKYFTGTTRNNAISIKLFFYKPYLYKYYISSEDHNVPKSYPTMIILMLVVICGLFYWGFSKLKGANSFGLFSEVEAKAKDQPDNKENNQTASNQPKSATNTSEPDCEDLNNNHLEKCIAYNKNKIDELNKSVREANSYYVNYDPTKPYDTQISTNYEATAKPVFSGCVKYNGKYYAYTQQGTKLNVESSVCKRLIDDGDRPFNYFANNNQNQLTQQLKSPTENLNQEQNQYSQQPVQMANNYVEPHLEPKHNNGANDLTNFSF